MSRANRDIGLEAARQLARRGYMRLIRDAFAYDCSARFEHGRHSDHRM